MRRVPRGDFLKDTAFVFGAQMVLNVSNYAFHFVVSRKLGVEQYGLVYSLLALLVIASIPATIVTLTMARVISELNAVGDREKISFLARRSFKILAILAMLVAVAFVATAKPLAAYFNTSSISAIYVIGLVIAINFIAPLVRGFLQGMQKFRALAVSYAIEGIGKVVLGSAFVIAGIGASGALGGIAIATLAACAACFFALRGSIDLRKAAETHIDVKRLAIVSIGAALTAAATSSLAYTDSILVKHLFPPAEAGLYSIVALVGKMLLFSVSFVPILVLPKATNMLATDRSPRRVLGQSALLFGVIACAGLLLLWFAPKTIVLITAGPAYLGAKNYIFEYGLAMCALAGVTIVAYYKIGIHQFDFVAPLSIVAVGEVIAITMAHSSIGQVINILCVGNTIALLASCYRVHEYKKYRASVASGSLPSTA